MAHEIDLKNYKLHTDMVVETYDKEKQVKGLTHKESKYKDILVEETRIEKEAEEAIGKKAGIYETITFQDITDKDNYKEVLEVLVDTLKKVYEEISITEDSKCLIIGLGNDQSTPDALGPNTVDNVLVTRHLFSLGEVEEGYRNTSIFKPNVTGVTGIETNQLIKGIVEETKPDFLIVIDALAAKAISRVNKTIQITDTGIEPGSGVGNTRAEISKESLHIPVIALGVPTIVDAATICYDTIQYMLKQFSYKIENRDNQKLKFVTESNQNYLNHEKELSLREKEKVLGMVGTLSEEEFKRLLVEVLSPIDYNLMVTPKEVDFIIRKLSTLIASAINKSLHKSYNTTN